MCTDNGDATQAISDLGTTCRCISGCDLKASCATVVICDVARAITGTEMTSTNQPRYRRHTSTCRCLNARSMIAVGNLRSLPGTAGCGCGCSDLVATLDDGSATHTDSDACSSTEQRSRALDDRSKT